MKKFYECLTPLLLPIKVYGKKNKTIQRIKPQIHTHTYTDTTKKEFPSFLLLYFSRNESIFREMKLICWNWMNHIT